MTTDKDCDCGAQNRSEHRPHARTCSVYSTEEPTGPTSMKNIIRPSVSNNSDGSVTIRPQPNRAKNLNSIADAIEAMTPMNGTEPVTLDAQTARKLWGYAQQIGIIAQEMEGKRK